MRKIFTLIAALFIGSAAFAQVDNTLQFTDKDGNVVEDGSTYHAYEWEDLGLAGGIQVKSNILIKNTTEKEVYAAIDYEFTQSNGGAIMACFPGSCGPIYFSDIKLPYVFQKRPAVPVLANESAELAAEWVVKNQFGGIPDEIIGTCTITAQLILMNHELVSDNGTPDDPMDDVYEDTEAAKGPKITIVFHNDKGTTGVSGVADTEQSKPVAYYSIDGRRLPVAQKGLNIVKFADGTTRKVVKK